MGIVEKDFEHIADESDRATDVEERARERSIETSRAAAALIPAGEAGDCDGCGEYFARLVGGLCGFCRDGRKRIASVEAVLV